MGCLDIQEKKRLQNQGHKTTQIWERAHRNGTVHQEWLSVYNVLAAIKQGGHALCGHVLCNVGLGFKPQEPFHLHRHAQYD